MQDDHVTPAWLEAIENIPQVVQIEVVADRNKNIPRPRADRFGAQFAFQFKIELVHLHVSHAAVLGASLRDGENDIQDHRKNATGECGYWLSEQVRDGNGNQPRGL